MKKIKLTLQYNGADYLGWQRQKDFHPTVQETLEKELTSLYKYPITTIGSGRTDTGVHSLCHIVIFENLSSIDIPYEGVKLALNASLPRDIRVLLVEDAKDFHPLADISRREYRYLFTNNSVASAFQGLLIYNHRFELNIEQMQNIAKLFEGTHDFTDFHCKGSDTKTNIRTIFECSINECVMDFHGILPSHYYLKIVGDGFLKQMVRSIMGCLFKAGEGKLTSSEIALALKTPSGKMLAPVASPCGLYKYKVTV